MKIILSIIVFIYAVIIHPVSDYEVSYSFDIDKEEIINEVNKLRAKGCYCGNDYQQPVGPVKWNQTLYDSAMSHAREMSKYNFFSHYSRSGKNLGQRLTKIGYPWKVVGENIAEGQRKFSQAMDDWIESETHCKMLMDKRVDEMAVARYKKYWVQHFGKQLPKQPQRYRKRSSN